MGKILLKLTDVKECLDATNAFHTYVHPSSQKISLLRVV